jgi:hypothetical protein
MESIMLSRFTQAARNSHVPPNTRSFFSSTQEQFIAAKNLSNILPYLVANDAYGKPQPLLNLRRDDGSMPGFSAFANRVQKMLVDALTVVDAPNVKSDIQKLAMQKDPSPRGADGFPMIDATAYPDLMRAVMTARDAVLEGKDLHNDLVHS